MTTTTTPTPRSYYGTRHLDGTCEVTMNDGQPLPMRLDLANHSPTGPEWGYAGSGPAQLALAILADYLSDNPEARAIALSRPGVEVDADPPETLHERLALRLHQQFKLQVLCPLNRSGFTLFPSDVRKFLLGLGAAAGGAR